ncbi:MAG: metal-sulfur cluster assembly factor [Methanothrix sp.]
MREALRDILDPEIGIDIVDLGLIEDIIVVNEDRVEVDMVLTSKACHMVNHLKEQVQRRIEGLNGIRHVAVNVLELWKNFHFSAFCR